jgi:hypothetical protein
VSGRRKYFTIRTTTTEPAMDELLVSILIVVITKTVHCILGLLSVGAGGIERSSGGEWSHCRRRGMVAGRALLR